MSHLLIGLSLALVGSVALNASYLIQHAGSVAEPTIAFRHPIRTLGSLLRSRLWLAGGALGIYLSGSACASACLLLVRQRRTQMQAAAGGILYGAADVAIKALTGLASHMV